MEDYDDDEPLCGWSHDHTERLTYRDEDTEQWECEECGAEWWVDLDPEP